MSSLPMYFPPAPFALDEAVRCAGLVATAYDMYAQWQQQGKPKPQHFTWVPNSPLPLSFGRPIFGEDTGLLFMKEREPFAFVAWSDADAGAGAEVLVVFRGTESVEDWIANLSTRLVDYTLVAGYGRVHDGFFRVYSSLREALLEQVNGACLAIGQAVGQTMGRAASQAMGQVAAITITGHSLGSALATLAVPDLLANSPADADAMRLHHYNLASPRAGDPDFAAAYNANGVATWRVVNTSDLVPTVPPAVLGDLLFEHVGTPVDFTAQYGSIGGNHSASDAYAYALAHPEQPQGSRGQTV